MRSSLAWALMLAYTKGSTVRQTATKPQNQMLCLAQPTMRAPQREL